MRSHHFWLHPEGFTSGGAPEAVVNQIPKDLYTAEKVIQ
jgi:hypothetical protein